MRPSMRRTIWPSVGMVAPSTWHSSPHPRRYLNSIWSKHSHCLWTDKQNWAHWDSTWVDTLQRIPPYHTPKTGHCISLVKRHLWTICGLSKINITEPLTFSHWNKAHRQTHSRYQNLGKVFLQLFIPFFHIYSQFALSSLLFAVNCLSIFSSHL